MSVKEARKSGLPIRLTLGLIVYMAAGMVVMATVLAQADSTGAIVMSVVLILMVLFAGVKLIDKWFIQPMLEFQSAVQRIGGIEGSGSPWVGGKDQWSALGRNLNNLVVRLKERIRVLEGERAKVTAILDSMVEGVIAVDGQGKILLLNPSARRILDLAQGGLEGQFLLEVVRNPELADVVESCGALETTEKCHREVELNLTHRRVLDVNAMPFLLSPDVRGVLIVLHDISELRRLEQVRSEFVANVSHELRTPLAAIKGYLETLLDEAPAEPKTYRRFLEGAHRHSERLARLLEDLHHLSDIESGRVVLHPKVIGLSGVVQEVTAIFEKEAAKREVALVNEIDPDPSAYADRDRLSQILVNLVDNALKYTSVGGQVRFSTGVAPDGQITLRIQDTGQGIPSTELPRLTERFFRVDKARSREEGGTGLGLAIVKHLVQLHGGTLHIESEFGKGTTVQFSLPISS